MYLGVYGGLGFLQSVSILAATILMAIGTLKSAAVLHQKMLSRILKAPMSFFDTTPLGRVINRFVSKIPHILCDGWASQYYVDLILKLIMS
jgi:ABC-type multidrug transport system fused ATPase/permease subunit